MGHARVRCVVANTGRVTFYDPNGNFGFIKPDDGSSDVLYSVRPGDHTFEVGATVGYILIPQPSVTQIGTQALRVWRTGFPRSAATDASDTTGDAAPVAVAET